MAHIILKTAKRPKIAPVAAIRPLDTSPQPLVIDFSKNYDKHFTAKTLWIILSVMMTFFAASLVALFILGQQVNNSWREIQNTNVSKPIVKLHAAAKTTDQPEAAFPATTLTPLPSKALILGKDFQQVRSPAKPVDLVPILEKLPLNGNSVRNTPQRVSNLTNSFVEVETIPAMTLSTSLQQQADAAVANGNTGKAIQLYLKAIKLNSGDVTLRQNCVALLLQQARVYDEGENIEAAMQAYQQADNLWQGDTATQQSIRARMHFLQAKR